MGKVLSFWHRGGQVDFVPRASSQVAAAKIDHRRRPLRPGEARDRESHSARFW
jgi:hypothetical protein